MANFSNTKQFSLPIDDLIREATERTGGKWDSAEEMDSAIRSLNLTIQDLMNRGKPLAQVQYQGAGVTVAPSVRDYSLSVGVAQVLGLVLRVSGANGPTDFPLNRVGFLDYNNISRKETFGQPTMYTVEKERDNITIKLWPTPTSLAVDPGYQLRFFGVEYPDTVTQLFQDPDVSRQYFPVLVNGLAYYMSLKRPDIPLDRIAMFKQVFEESVVMAFGEDREQVSHVVRPITGWWQTF